MKKHTLFFSFLLLFFTANGQLPWDNGKLKVNENGRYLQHENGAPFFWQGDTGWLLFQRLNRDEVKQYFANRRDKGFNVIQSVFFQFYTDKMFMDRFRLLRMI